MALERLQKVLARAGVASRRKCEELIAAGRVSVDGLAVRQMGVKVDPERQQVCFDGRAVELEQKVYYVVNKPRGFICTSRADAARFPAGSLAGHVAPGSRAIDLVPARGRRLFTVGRLDRQSEGLLIVTNDGAFANRIAHPRYGIPKSYLAEVEGAVGSRLIEQLVAGIELDGELARAVRARLLQRSAERARLELTLVEGRKREIRRMLEALGLRVTRLVRTRIGSLRLEGIAPGRHRELRPDEVKALLSCARPQRPSPSR